MEKPRLVIFDIDGTLIPGTSCERMFTRYLVKNRIVDFSNLLSFIIRGVTLIPRGRSYIIKANKGYLRGFNTGYMDNIGKRFFESHVEKRISAKGINALTAHKMRGHKVVLLSGMPEFLLENFSKLFKVSEYYGSVMEIDNDKFTGRTVGPFPLAKGKVEVIEQVLKEHNLQWDDVTAYADHYLDRFLLLKVGHPVAVNPNDKLKSIAEENSWQIEHFD